MSDSPVIGVDNRPFVYSIYCNGNGKIYVGSTGVRSRPGRRFTEHRYQLNKGVHGNKHLQSAWNKYGEESFVFDVLEYVDDAENLLQRESYHIESFRSWDQEVGFNLIRRPTSPILSDESKRKMSAAHRGVKLSAEHAANIGKANIGRKQSEKQKAAIRESNQNRIWSLESRKKISDSVTGRFVGEDCPTSKLTWVIVREIRQKYAAGGQSYRSLGQEYGIDQTTMAQIVKRKTWREDA